MKSVHHFTLCFGILFLAMNSLCSCASTPEKATRPKAYPQAILTMNKGVEWYEKGCYDKSIQLFWNAHEQFSALDLPWGVAASYNNIGNASRHMGETEKSMLFLRQAFRIYQQLNTTDREIKVLADLAATQITAGNLQTAESYLDQGEQLAGKIEDESIPLSMTRGILLTHQKKYDLARKKLLSLMKRITAADLILNGTLNSALGNLEYEAGNPDAAERYFRLALEFDQKSGYYRGIANSLSKLGHIYVAQKDSRKGVFYLERSVKIYALLGVGDRVADLSSQIKSLAESTGQDMELTLNLVNRWLSGEVYHPICD